MNIESNFGPPIGSWIGYWWNAPDAKILQETCKNGTALAKGNREANRHVKDRYSRSFLCAH